LLMPLDHLDFLVCLQPLRTAFAPDARHSEPPEWLTGSGAEAVDVHLTGAQPRGELLGPVEIRRVDRGTQAVGRIVRNPYRVVLVLVPNHCEDWPKDLLAGNPHRVRHILEQ